MFEQECDKIDLQILGFQNKNTQQNDSMEDLKPNLR